MLLREIKAEIITEKIKEAFIAANLHLPDEITARFKQYRAHETNPLAVNIFDKMLENADLADKLHIPVCQDTGMAVLFVEVGQDIHIHGNLTGAVNEGVRRAYIDGDLRLSVVGDPLDRKNTNDNTPAIIHYDIVPGDRIKIHCMPKGFGSENMSALKMFTPSAEKEDIIGFVTDTVRKAGSMPCPPVILGIGIGGDFEYAAILAKKALLLRINDTNDEFASEILAGVNSLGIGAQGFGGDITCLAVGVERFATHIAGLPVAVNVCCHVYRHAEIEI